MKAGLKKPKSKTQIIDSQNSAQQVSHQQITVPQILEILEIGRLAPSADNLQPWYFQLVPNGFEMLVDTKGLGKFFDAGGVATQLSFGAVIENMTLFAASLGYDIEINEIQKMGYDLELLLDVRRSEPRENQQKAAFLQYLPLLRGHFKPRGERLGSHNQLREDLENRHTDRNFFHPFKSLPPDLILQMENEVHLQGPGYQWVPYYSRGHKWALMNLIAKADTVRFTNQKCHQEFAQVIRWKVENQENSLDGLAEETLGIGALTARAFRFSMKWSHQKWMNKLGLHYVSAFRATWILMGASSEVFALIHQGSPDYYEAGRLMERLWFKANQRGVQVQLLGALPLFLVRLNLFGGRGFSESEKLKIKECQKKLVKLTPGLNPELDQLVMFFRMGYGLKNAKFSKRRLLKDLFVPKSSKTM